MAEPLARQSSAHWLPHHVSLQSFVTLLDAGTGSCRRFGVELRDDVASLRRACLTACYPSAAGVGELFLFNASHGVLLPDAGKVEDVLSVGDVLVCSLRGGPALDAGSLVKQLQFSGTVYKRVSHQGMIRPVRWHNRHMVLRRARMEWKSTTISPLKRGIPDSANRAVGTFGAPLDDRSPVSSCLRESAEYLQSNDRLRIEGLFRIPGSASVVADLRRRYNNGERRVLQTTSEVDAHDVASLFVMFLGSLPEPLWRPGLLAPLLEAARGDCDPDAVVVSATALVDQLPAASRVCLKFVLDFLQLVAGHSDASGMTAENLAICLAPAVFGQQVDPFLLSEAALVRSTLALLITSVDEVFQRRSRPLTVVLPPSPQHRRPFESGVERSSLGSPASPTRSRRRRGEMAVLPLLHAGDLDDDRGNDGESSSLDPGAGVKVVRLSRSELPIGKLPGRRLPRVTGGFRFVCRSEPPPGVSAQELVHDAEATGVSSVLELAVVDGNELDGWLRALEFVMDGGRAARVVRDAHRTAAGENEAVDPDAFVDAPPPDELKSAVTHALPRLHASLERLGGALGGGRRPTRGRLSRVLRQSVTADDDVGALATSIVHIVELLTSAAEEASDRIEQGAEELLVRHGQERLRLQGEIEGMKIALQSSQRREDLSITAIQLLLGFITFVSALVALFVAYESSSTDKYALAIT